MRMMKALYHEKAGRPNASVRMVPYPTCGDDEVIIKVMACGICKWAEINHDTVGGGGTLAQYPVITGHEFAGYIVEKGKNVTELEIGERVTADNAVPCGHCWYCKNGKPLLCEHFGSYGHNKNGGFAQYMSMIAKNVVRVPDNLSFDEASVTEPVACAMECFDRANIQPGERVPIDGVIVEGASTLNTAALTGESLPRDVRSGDEVISGCVNMSGLLKVRTTKEFGESTVSKILDLVENSSMKKARAENFITRFARVYTPAVCYGALALAFIPPIVLLLMGQPARFGDWVYRALTFLVISCPCALVISIPLSFFGGIGGASACGILVKGSTYLEELADTRVVVFDKTGTLTQGTFKVVKVCPVEGGTEDSLVEAAALAESWSKHPISLSIKAAYGKDIDAARVTDVEELGGHGVTAKVDGKPVAAGNARLMAKLGLAVPDVPQTGTIVHVAIDGKYAGYLLISDVVKPHSAQAIKGLKQAGVRKTVMLTGDAEPVAKAVSAELGIDEYHAGLLPGDKVDQIEKLLAAKNPKEMLAFVGDGINDAPVLSRVDVGIAMGALGSDAAIEAADVVLMDDDPAKIALAMRIARRTKSIVYQNIVFALAIKAACLLLGALGIANMWVAIFADVGVMVLAVLNATRALYTKDLTKK